MKYILSLCNLVVVKIFVSMTPMAEQRILKKKKKKKEIRFNYAKINFCITKNIINKVKN